MKFLIVKTSAIGDVVQTFPVLDYLRSRFPEAQIDWVVERAAASLLLSHPQLSKVHLIDIKKWRKSLGKKSSWTEMRAFFRELRGVEYDVLFDLQGNTKSAFITAFARAKEKVGFGLRSLREKPNALATNVRFNVPQEGNIRARYLNLVLRYFKDSNSYLPKGVSLNFSSEEAEQLQQILSATTSNTKIMVAFGSKWPNKQPTEAILLEVLKRIHQSLAPDFLFIYGSEEERSVAEQFAKQFPTSQSVGRLSLPLWQALMGQVTALLAVDSAGLHLCGTTDTPSFSLFGPSASTVFMPLGSQHGAFQGKCPYGQIFEKQCALLRTCTTGACLREQNPEEIFEQFMEWWRSKEVQSRCGLQPLESLQESSPCHHSQSSH